MTVAIASDIIKDIRNPPPKPSPDGGPKTPPKPEPRPKPETPPKPPTAPKDPDPQPAPAPEPKDPPPKTKDDDSKDDNDMRTRMHDMGWSKFFSYDEEKNVFNLSRGFVGKMIDNGIIPKEKLSKIINYKNLGDPIRDNPNISSGIKRDMLDAINKKLISIDGVPLDRGINF
ncbi:MAG: hypothetical protein HQK51_20485 [Oligoflexia bacterium]|nr:hypothetical protein [Oligoflexia bacterium]